MTYGPGMGEPSMMEYRAAVSDCVMVRRYQDMTAGGIDVVVLALE